MTLLKRITFTLLLGLGLMSRGTAAEQASALLTSTTLTDGEGYEYTVTLTDTGTTNLETFWYAWTPGQDYMPVSPTDIESPTGWSANITGGGSNNGYAVQWLTSSSATPNPLTPGNSFSFSFDSTASPSTLSGFSPFYPNTPIGTSFVYNGAPFSDQGFKFVASNVVPEPSVLTSLILGVAATGIILLRRRRMREHQRTVTVPLRFAS